MLMSNPLAEDGDNILLEIVRLFQEKKSKNYYFEKSDMLLGKLWNVITAKAVSIQEINNIANEKHNAVITLEQHLETLSNKDLTEEEKTMVKLKFEELSKIINSAQRLNEHIQAENNKYRKAKVPNSLQKHHGQQNFEKLPPEIKVEIMTFLGIADLLKMKEINKLFKEIVDIHLSKPSVITGRRQRVALQNVDEINNPHFLNAASNAAKKISFFHTDNKRVQTFNSELKQEAEIINKGDKPALN